MPLDQRIRTLGAPFCYGLLKKTGSSSSGKQSSVVRTYSRVVRALNFHGRRSATPPPSLPVELWTKIIHDLGHMEWVVLCRVCWLLYQIAQPCLYEDIMLHIWTSLLHRAIFDKGSGGPHLQFKRTIDQRPELGAYVRSLTLDMVDGPGPNHRKRYPLLFELYLFRNLESLQVSRIHFDLELCNILHSHPCLKSVTVTSCTVDESLAIRRIDQDRFPHSSISTVKVLYPKHNPVVHAWTALAPAKLESLAVLSGIWPVFDAGLILNRLWKSNKTNFLTMLSLDKLSPAVVRFLIASPQLRHLILDYDWIDHSPSSLISLPADAIPFLEEYSGPAGISLTFIRGRPVQAVKLIFPRVPEDRLVEILISLQSSAVPLTSLGLNLRNATLGSWLFHIPVTVRYLAVEYIDWATFTKWLPALSHLTSLQTLSFPGKFTLPIQRKLNRDEIMQLSDTFQSLREIDIGPQRWRIAGQCVWESFTVKRTM